MNLATSIITYLLFGYIFLWLGNFLTSFYFRIPRGIPLNGFQKPPMCSNCGVRLKWPNYGPLYSFIFTKGCKSCSAEIPAEYFLIELITGVFLTVNALLKPINYHLVSESILILFTFLNGFIAFRCGKVFWKSVAMFAFSCFLYSYQNIISDPILYLKKLGFFSFLSVFNWFLLYKNILKLPVKFNQNSSPNIILIGLSGLFLGFYVWFASLVILNLFKVYQVKKYPKYDFYISIFCAILVLRIIFFK